MIQVKFTCRKSILYDASNIYVSQVKLHDTNKIYMTQVKFILRKWKLYDATIPKMSDFVISCKSTTLKYWFI